MFSWRSIHYGIRVSLLIKSNGLRLAKVVAVLDNWVFVNIHWYKIIYLFWCAELTPQVCMRIIRNTPCIFQFSILIFGYHQGKTRQPMCNNEARSPNHLPWESTKYCIFWVSVCSLRLSIMQCACAAILSPVTCPALQYFSSLSRKRYDFRKK